MKEKILSDLEKLGLQKGDSLLVHASLNSIGKFKNSAEELINALLESVGQSGTLLLPALSYETVTKANPVFDLLKTGSCVGALTEYFRLRDDTKRSIHPTHSVCGKGKDADFFLIDHFKDNTPCGENSPFRKLREAEGKILFIGCGLKPNTSMHAIEEIVKPPYLLDEELEYKLIINGNELLKKYFPHNFKGYEQRYDRIESLLDDNECRKGNILKADCFLVETKPLWKKSQVKLKTDPFYFVDQIKIVEK